MGYSEKTVYHYPDEELQEVVGKKFKLSNVDFDPEEAGFFNIFLVIVAVISVGATLIAYVFGAEWTLWHLIPMGGLLVVPTFFLIGLGLQLLNCVFLERQYFREKQRQAKERGFITS